VRAMPVSQQRLVARTFHLFCFTIGMHSGPQIPLFSKFELYVSTMTSNINNKGNHGYPLEAQN
jgi:hypothetical protein